MTNLVDQPIEVLGAYVISANANIGLGGSESSMTLELVEDCNSGKFFLPKVNPSLYGVGSAVNIEIGDFFFGGYLTNWTENLSSNGYTFSATISDPRSMFENMTIISDSYIDVPVVSTNYVNVYCFLEGSILYNNSCNAFGISEAVPRGMPYNKIMYALQAINPVILTNTGFPYLVNWSTVLGSPSFAPVDINGTPYGFDNSIVPDYYKVSGPANTLLSLLQGVCDLVGLEFFVYVTNGYMINIGYVDLRQTPTSFAWIKDKFAGKATEISYGEEIRNEKSKNLIIGEQQHYMSITNEFDFYFGEDRFGALLYPVVPFARNECGFWINKKIDALNIQLDIPLNSDGPFWISEMDIRTAMSGYNLWRDRVMSTTVKYNDNPRTLNYQIRQKWAFGSDGGTYYMETLNRGANAAATGTNKAKDNMGRMTNEAVHAMNPPAVNLALPNNEKQLEAIHSFVSNLGSTYYGKQFITNLPNKICKNYSIPGDPTSEPVFTDQPTSAGAWVDYGIPVLGLRDPELGLFRQEDHRLNCFIRFDITAPVGPDLAALIKGLNINGESDEDLRTPEEGVPDYSNPPPTASTTP